MLNKCKSFRFEILVNSAIKSTWADLERKIASKRQKAGFKQVKISLRAQFIRNRPKNSVIIPAE